jgi:hypothetical protein
VTASQTPIGSIWAVELADKSDQARQKKFAAASNLPLAPRSINACEDCMGPAAVGSAIGAAALTFGQGAVGAAGKGLSFAAELLGGGKSSSDAAQESTQSANAAMKLRCHELSNRIGRQLAAAGIQLSEPVDLISNGQGGIAVASDHPQRAAIEAALGNDVLLERDFNTLSGDYEEFAQASGAGESSPTLVVTIPKAS